MSRHRYVRNLDLDAELADDHPVGDYDYDEEGGSDEPDDGMSPEERAQMASALPVVRAELKDLKPPISDQAIQDSLWHYWFDVEKTISWLKKDWEKKGDGIPPELVPTPDQQPRPRPSRPEKAASSLEPVASTLTALQRLSLARKAGVSSNSATSTPTTSAVPSPSATPAADSPAKPLSKLALLAQKRREEAAKAQVDQSSSTPSVSTPTATPPDVLSPTPTKPLSKLAQKMAAARAAREIASPSAGPSVSATPQEPSTPTPEPVDEMWAFSEPSSSATHKPTSTFFSILTSHNSEASVPEPPSLADMHIAVRGDREVASRRVREAFGPDVESPDDIVLRKRDGRAGTGAVAPTENKAPPTVMRAAKQSDETEPPSEAASASVPPQAKSQPRQKASKPPAKSDKANDKDVKPGRKPPPKAPGGGTKKPAGGPKGRAQVAKAKEPPATARSKSLPAKQRVQSQGGMSRTTSTSPTSSRGGSVASTPKKGSSTPRTPLSVAQTDMAGLHLGSEVDEEEMARERAKYQESFVPSMKQEEIIAKVKLAEDATGKKNISLVVIGHVDAGKSTLMGRLLYELGEMSEREKEKNERGSKRVGKGSFAFAWGLDALGDERDRGVTIDIATTHFETPHRNVTLLDAPGHRDFIPAMISGAAQADVALMVVDGSPGEFEAGFQRNGQTREHAWLVRSLGVKEIVVGINKMDMVGWSQDRYDDIVDALRPFLASAGFAAAKTIFLPLAAMEGTNVADTALPEAASWYKGPTLVQSLDKVDVPERPYASPLRIPLSNVFKGQTAVASGVAVQGRLASGIVQVGDNVRGVPGDGIGSVRTIEVDDDTAPYAVAGQNITLYLAGIDPNQLAIGSVLCPPNRPVRLVTRFSAQILVFDVSMPIITGASVELFHHSVNVPATITKLLAVMEKGQVVKKNPRVLQKGTTAMVELTLRSSTGSSRTAAIPLETAVDNKEMGRVLIRRGGETIAAGMVMDLFE